MIRPEHSGKASEPRPGNRNPSRSGLLLIDNSQEKPSQTQIAGVAIASAMDDSHETSATADSLSPVVLLANSGKMNPDMHTLHIDEDLPDLSTLGAWSHPSS